MKNKKAATAADNVVPSHLLKRKMGVLIKMEWERKVPRHLRVDAYALVARMIVAEEIYGIVYVEETEIEQMFFELGEIALQQLRDVLRALVVAGILKTVMHPHLGGDAVFFYINRGR